MAYYMVHDPVFTQKANLKYFNKKILNISGLKETMFLFNLVKDAPSNSVILDIGAFNGDTSIVISKMLKNINRNDLKIICFEPNVQNCNKIKQAKEKFNLNIDIINKIISNKEQTLYMKKNEGAGTMYDTCYSNSVKYDAITIDSLDIQNVYFAKIDVEGHEPEVLEGARNTLKQTKFIYVESWNDGHFKNRHLHKLTGSHNERILNQINQINTNFYPIQKVEKNILYELRE